MKYMIPLFIILVCLSCTNDNEQFVVDIDLELSVKDAMGNDLLNPDNPNAFIEDKINIYYKKNEGKALMFEGNLTHPEGFFIYEHDDEFRIRLFPYSVGNVEFPVTYIE